MAQFDRYTDKENRLFIVLHDFCNHDKKADGTWITVRTSVELLNVYGLFEDGKKTREMPAADFDRFIDKGLLIFNGK